MSAWRGFVRETGPKTHSSRTYVVVELSKQRREAILGSPRHLDSYLAAWTCLYSRKREVVALALVLTFLLLKLRP